jgi:cell division protein FtsQ
MRDTLVALRVRWRLVAIGAGVLILASSPIWGRALLSTMSFFRLRQVEVHGIHYLAANDVRARLNVDTTRSIWMDFDSLRLRLTGHPQIRSVTFKRKLPGTLVVFIEENLPVALTPTATGFHVLDAHGVELPVDPSFTTVDLPVVASRDTAALRLLATIRESYPDLYDRVSAVRRVAPGEFLVQLTDVRVRTLAGVTAQRFADILPVEADLARRQLRAAELDLRYHEQVIARLP